MEVSIVEIEAIKLINHETSINDRIGVSRSYYERAIGVLVNRLDWELGIIAEGSKKCNCYERNEEENTHALSI